MSDEPEKRGRGLTMPGNPALELQRMMLEEARLPVGRAEEKTEPAPLTQTNPSDNEPTNQPTNLRVKELTNEPTNQLTSQGQQPTRRPRPAKAVAGKRSEAQAQTEVEMLTNRQTNQLTNQLGGDKASETDAARRRGAYARARTLGDTEMKVIGLKVPDGLNDYLDDYYHQHRKSGLKKQDLVKLALQWLVVHLEAEDRIEDLA